jgi:galactose mutarotase-like enzyme
VKTIRRVLAGSQLEVIPERGGLVSRLVLDGLEVLYLNPETVADTTRSVRGGIPVLFPLCGPLPGGQYTLGGETRTMPSHGFARNLPWQVLESEALDRLHLQLCASEATRGSYPFEFTFDLHLLLQPRSLRIEVQISNHSPQRMPFALGFHPYFLLQSRRASSLQLQAARVARNPAGDPHPAWVDVDIANPDLDDGYTGLGGVHAVLRDPLREAEVRLRAPNEFAEVVVWTQDNDSFVCVEPWTARGHAVAACVGVRWIEPSHTWSSWLEVERTDPAPTPAS